MKLRDLTIAVLVAFLVTGVFALPHLDRVRGLSIDILFLFRQMMFAPSDEKIQSHAVVIAIDEETYRRAPFQDTPKTMWTPQIGRVLDNVISGGAKVVGFDVIFPTSVGKFVRGYDRPFLIALRKASRKGQIVLGKVQHQLKPIIPHRMQSFAVGHQKNIRTTNVFEDPDGIIRQVPLVVEGIVKSTGKTRPEPTLSLELVMRAVGVNKVTWKNGPVVIDGYTVPGSNSGRMTLNFSGNLNAIPTYSLADLHKCADS
ncbi:MAG TPA: CHASE2 domain-containing protein, partial [Alphaproteobacteria bacterium]|nr:CHASE2 domain-containing protein [Alphaproteobacteria bacterium]